MATTVLLIEEISEGTKCGLSLYKGRENGKTVYVIGEGLCGVLFCPTKRFKGLQEAQKYFNEIE